MRFNNFCIYILSIVLVAVQGTFTQEFRDYQRIDAWADQTPSHVTEDAAVLAAYLIKQARNDYEKIRSLYRWITQNIEYDAESFFLGEYKHLNPDQVLKERKAVCQGYASLLEVLGKKAGLNIEVIYGYSKGYEYNAGDYFNGGPNHAWNAVKIGHEWYLLDVTWGAGFLDEQMGFVKKFQDYYFLTPADEFIYDHFPDQSKWQLIDHTISLDEFIALPIIQPSFFEYGISLKSHHQSVIRALDDLQIDFYVPDQITIAGQLEKNKRELDRNLTFAQRNSGQINLGIYFPEPGEYYLKVYAKPSARNDAYQLAVEYKIIADRGSEKRFPSTFAAFFDKQVYLFEPFQNLIGCKQVQKFKVFIPGAREASIKNNDNWHALSKQGQQFEGSYQLQRGKVTLYAKFTDGTRFTGLLEWLCQ